MWGELAPPHAPQGQDRSGVPWRGLAPPHAPQGRNRSGVAGHMGTGEVRRASPLGEIYQNEFAMVELSRHETESGPRRRIRDLASGAKSACFRVVSLSRSTGSRETSAPLVDPSGLVGLGE